MNGSIVLDSTMCLGSLFQSRMGSMSACMCYCNMFGIFGWMCCEYVDCLSCVNIYEGDPYSFERHFLDFFLHAGR